MLRGKQMMPATECAVRIYVGVELLKEMFFTRKTFLFSVHSMMSKRLRSEQKEAAYGLHPYIS